MPRAKARACGQLRLLGGQPRMPASCATTALSSSIWRAIFLNLSALLGANLRFFQLPPGAAPLLVGLVSTLALAAASIVSR